MRRLAHALLVLLILPALVTGQVTVTSSGSVDVTANYSFTGTETFAGQTNISGPKANTNVEIGSITSNANAGTSGFSTVVGGASVNSGNGVSNTILGSTNTQSAGGSSIIVGVSSSSGFGSSTLIAVSGTTTASNQFVAGSSTVPMNTVYFGKGVTNATATSYTISGTGGTGTDNAGGSLVLAPGPGTSAGASGSVILSRDLRAATGTTPQVQAHAYIICPSKILSNTTATLTTLATIGLASNSGGSAMAYFTVVATDGTNFDTDAQEMNFAFVNKATAITTNASAAIGDATIGNSGSTTVGATITTGSALVNINVTPVFTTIVPTTVTGYVTITNNGAGTVICQ